MRRVGVYAAGFTLACLGGTMGLATEDDVSEAAVDTITASMNPAVSTPSLVTGSAAAVGIGAVMVLALARRRRAACGDRPASTESGEIEAAAASR